MTTTEQRRHIRFEDGGDFQYWRDHTQISLQPVAAPSVLGLFGLAGATFIVAANLAGWYGSTTSPQYLFPFAAMFGGLAQFLAGMWAYRARDVLATAMHGTWGSFWLGYGILYLLVATGVLSVPARFTALGYWFIALAFITLAGTITATTVNLGFASVLAALTVGSALLAVGLGVNSSAWRVAGGWAFVVASVLAWYTATALLMESTLKRTVLPMGKIGSTSNGAGRIPNQPIEYRAGDPGVRIGQ